MSGREAWPLAAAAWLSVLIAACGSPDDAGQGGNDSSSAADGGAEEGGGGSTSATNVPVECRGVSMFETRECLDALRAYCLPRREGDCAAAELVDLGDPGFSSVQVACRWADVVTIADAASCAVASITGRCEAVMPQFDHLCGEGACEGPGLYSAWMVLPDEPSELVKTDCGPPLGYWAEVGYGYQPDEGTCLDNVHPPAPPLCECADAACTALGEL